MNINLSSENPPGRGIAGSAVIVLLSVMLAFPTIAYGGVDTASITVLTILAAGVALIWIAASWIHSEFRINPSALQLPLIAWIAIGVVQLLPLSGAGDADLLTVPVSRALSLDPFETRLFIVRLVIYLIFFAAALKFIDNPATRRRMAYFIIIFGALMAFFGILQWLGKPDGIYGMRPTPQSIPFASYFNQHHFAALMEMTIGLTFGVLWAGKLKLDRAPLLIFGCIVMALAVVLTSSRGGMLSLIAVIAFIAVVTRIAAGKKTGGQSSVQGKLAAVAGIIAVVVVFTGMVLFLGGADSMLRGIGAGSPDDVTNGRAHFWATAWKIFVNNPLLGVGFDAFGVAYTKFDTMNGIFRVEQAHNDYLQTLTDGGIIAFAALIVFLYFLYRKGFKVIAETRDELDRSIVIGALAGCTGIVVHSFFDFPLRTPANGFFFLMLAALATIKIESFNPRR